MRKRNAQLLTTIGHLTHAIGEQSKILILIFHIPHILKHIEIVDLRWVNTKWETIQKYHGNVLRFRHSVNCWIIYTAAVHWPLFVSVFFFLFSICVLFAFNDDVYFLHLFTTTIPFWMNGVWMLVELRFTIWCSHLKFCWIKMIWVIVSGCECVFACMRVFKSANEYKCIPIYWW